jgi:hypothetical protein
VSRLVGCHVNRRTAHVLLDINVFSQFSVGCKRRRNNSKDMICSTPSIRTGVKWTHFDNRRRFSGCARVEIPEREK